MLQRARAQYHEIRLTVHGGWLRRRERAALRRLGQEITRTEAIPREHVRSLVDQALAALARVERLRAQRRGSIEADRADMAVVAAWVRPAVVLRGICTRLVLRHRQSAETRALDSVYQSIGALAAERTGARTPLTGEVDAIRAELTETDAARARWGFPYGGSALPAWSARVGRETAGFGRAVGRQLRSSLLPRMPALAGLAVGWWIADTFTDSHLRSTLRSIGIGSGGTRVVSASTYDAMSFWLPLLAAALCAYVGERIGGFYAAPDGAREGSPGGG